MESNVKSFDLRGIEQLDDISSIDLANELSYFDDEEIKVLCYKLDDETLARVLEEAEFKNQNRIIKYLNNDRILRVFKYMSKDDIVDILGDINIGTAKDLINRMQDAGVDTNYIRKQKYDRMVYLGYYGYYQQHDMTFPVLIENTDIPLAM